MRGCTRPANSARVFVIAGGNADGPSSYWMELLRTENAELVSTWHICTNLTDEMAREWAAAAAAARPVYVVLFSDGSISGVADPRTGEIGFADWSYDVIKKTSFVLSHGGMPPLRGAFQTLTGRPGYSSTSDAHAFAFPYALGTTAHLIATAEDAFNPSTDNMPMPGPGMFCAMFRKLLHPLGGDRLHICGKGGNEGTKYMLSHGMPELQTSQPSRLLFCLRLADSHAICPFCATHAFVSAPRCRDSAGHAC